jgi:hypothetical protein
MFPCASFAALRPSSSDGKSKRVFSKFYGLKDSKWNANVASIEEMEFGAR